MLRILAALVLTFSMLLIGCGGGANTPEGVMNDQASAYKDASAAIAGITDEASAKAAAPKVVAALQRFKDLGTKLDAMKKDLTAQDATKMMQVVLPASMEFQSKLMELQTKNAAAYKALMEGLGSMKP